MACCIIGAVILSQIFLLWSRVQYFFGIRDRSGEGRNRAPSAEVVTAAYLPGVPQSRLAEPIVSPKVKWSSWRPRHLRLAAFIVLQFILGGQLAVHWQHVGHELRSVGAWIGMTSSQSEFVRLCESRIKNVHRSE